ncbi:MAG: hypothetical protein LEGION0403_FIIPPAGN_02540 [Legionella sp.]|uniref:hypothetical protein n=1 Tax=Legionella sp. TaxID=459 RepID=UPI003D10E968
MDYLKQNERTLAFKKAREISYQELSNVTGGSNLATQRLDRTITNTPSGPDELVQVISD